MVLELMTKSRRCVTLDRFLEQKRTPVFTALSLLTTVQVWVAVIAVSLNTPRDPVGPLAQFYILIFVLLLGLVINTVLGSIAAYRDEYWVAALRLSELRCTFDRAPSLRRSINTSGPKVDIGK